MTRLTTPTLVQFLQLREGFRKHAYDDKNPNRTLKEDTPIEGTLTIGYGTTTYPDGTPVRWNDVVSKSEAVEYLDKYIETEVEPALRNLIHVNLEPHQFDALGSQLYQYGTSEFGTWNLVTLINRQRPWWEIAAEWFNGTVYWHGRPLFWSRRLMEFLMFAGLEWRIAVPEFDPAKPPHKQAADVVNTLDPQFPALEPQPQTVDGGDPIADPTPETPITTEDANIMQLEALKKGRKLNITELTPKVPATDVAYLTETAQGDLQVKKIGNSRRGKGYAKQQTGKEVGITAGVGAAATMTGAAEPVLNVVDKYPSQTLAWVIVGLGIFAIIYWAYGKYQQQRGEDEADTLLG